MKKYLLTISSIVILSFAGRSQGIYVFSGSETTNFGTFDFNTPGGQTWGTARAAAPGYFSAVIGANFTSSSDAENVNGYVKKYGNEAFTFPVGSGTALQALSISAPATATDAYATAWIVGDPGGNLDPTAPNAGAHSTLSVTYPISSVSNVGQWDWQVGNAGNLGTGTTGTGVGLTITVKIPDMTTFAGLASNLRLVGWNGASWIDLSGTATASGLARNSTLSGTMKTGITAIGIGSITWALPLKLASFTASPQNCQAALSWTTEEEVETQEFDIEQSADGARYNKIGTVAAEGNGPGGNYSYLAAQSNGLSYYRLKMVDISGNFTYSPVRTVATQCGAETYFTVYPNPVTTNSITLSFQLSYTGKANIFFTNEIGQQFLRAAIQVTEGINTTHINISQLPAGIYYIQMVDSHGQRLAGTQKLIKR